MSIQAKAQTPTQSPTPSSAEASKNQPPALARCKVLPAASSLVLDPFGFSGDSPFSTLRKLQQEMNQVFSPAGLSHAAARVNNSSVAAWMPPLESATKMATWSCMPSCRALRKTT